MNERFTMPRLYFRPDRGWYIELERGRSRALHTKDKTEAKRLYARIVRELMAGKLAHLTGQCTKRLGDYANEFLAWSEINQPRATWRANRLALFHLRAVAGDATLLDKVSLKHLDDMVTAGRRRGLAVASLNNYIRHARAGLNKAVEWGYLRLNPLARAKELRTERKQPGYLPTREDIARFLAAVEDMELRRLATAYLATGRRRAELLELEWVDVDLSRGRYLVRRSKTHLSRWYPINSAFRAVLESMGGGSGRVFGRWRHADTVSKVVKRALVEAGFAGLNLHSLRHTFASQQVMQGRTLRDVQELLGHTESRTTEIYAHIADDHLAEAAEIYLGPVDLGLGRADQTQTKTTQLRKKIRAAD